MVGEARFGNGGAGNEALWTRLWCWSAWIRKPRLIGDTEVFCIVLCWKNGEMNWYSCSSLDHRAKWRQSTNLFTARTTSCLESRALEVDSWKSTTQTSWLTRAGGNCDYGWTSSSDSDFQCEPTINWTTKFGRRQSPWKNLRCSKENVRSLLSGRGRLRGFWLLLMAQL